MNTGVALVPGTTDISLVLGATELALQFGAARLIIQPRAAGPVLILGSDVIVLIQHDTDIVNFVYNSR